MGRKIFETVNLHNLTLRNRLIRSATWEGIADFDGSITDRRSRILTEILGGIKSNSADGVGSVYC